MQHHFRQKGQGHLKELAKECVVTTDLAGRVDLVVRHLTGVSRSQVRALIGRGIGPILSLRGASGGSR